MVDEREPVSRKSSRLKVDRYFRSDPPLLELEGLFQAHFGSRQATYVQEN